MGTVYLATRLSLGCLVALKVMCKRRVADPVFVARFTREAFAEAQLSHPNIAQIHDIGEADGALLQLGVRARQVPFEGHQGV